MQAANPATQVTDQSLLIKSANPELSKVLSEEPSSNIPKEQGECSIHVYSNCLHSSCSLPLVTPQV